MGLSVWQIAIVAVLIVLLFGRGKISDLMGDVAKGIRNFREGMKDEDKEDEEKSDESQRLLSSEDKTVDVTPEKDRTAKS